VASAPLEGQVALVTGGSRGIGRGIGKRLAALGAEVFLNFQRDEAAADETLSSIRRAGGRGDLARFDVSDAEAVGRAVDDICRRSGRLDVLVNNAGMTIDNLVLRLKPEEWDTVMAVNLRGTFNCTRAALKTMVRSRYGRIVNLSSVTGLMGNAGQAAYAAAKAGVIGFTKATAREVASRNITVNAVAPGLIETEMSADLPESRRKEYLSLVPAGRLGTVEEVADLVGFLVRRETGYITGQVIGINGGLYM
jgi:3-oxoacyl-[acyl-carrier protein] reductase